MTSRMDIEAKVRSELQRQKGEPFIPELMKTYSGKVCDIYTGLDPELLIFYTSDRVSAFDHILDTTIPYKGAVLNGIARWGLDGASEICPTAVVDYPASRVMTQKRAANIGIECVVRGYMWGSMASEYEDGSRKKCGVELPDGLKRYQKLTEPLFTPTTKAEHDEDISFQDMAKHMEKHLRHFDIDINGGALAAQVRALSMRLYAQGQKQAFERGLILIDTKYEFGIVDGALHLIDEVHTPDSSRYVEQEEYMNSYGKGEKIKELSKQFVRDALLEAGYEKGSETPPSLTQEQVVETAVRYIQLYERVVGKDFDFPQHEHFTRSLIEQGLANPAAIILAGSSSDYQHVGKLVSEFQEWGIPVDTYVASAHKQGGKLEGILQTLNEHPGPLAIVAVAGGTDALSGTAGFHSNHPVISCPPDGKENTSVLHNPKGSSNMTVYNRANTAQAVAQLFSAWSPDIRSTLERRRNNKIAELNSTEKLYV